MIELKLYRHKTYKNLYLKRSIFCGGNADTQFYDVTENIVDAIRSYLVCNGDFEHWMGSFPNGTTKTVIEKEIEFDGFKGVLKKELELKVSDFELITLREVEE